MAIRIKDNFQVEAPVGVVWSFFQDVPRIVPCMPGARLIRVIDANSYEGEAQVKLGFLTVKFGGIVTIEKVDPVKFQMTILARGDQKGAIGRAEVRVQLLLKVLNPHLTEVVVTGDLTIFGKLAQVGGGMIQSVAKQVFSKFSNCAQREILTGKDVSDENDPD